MTQTYFLGESTVIALGKVKWFGSYNFRTGKAQDFGFITPDDPGPDLFVHKTSFIGIDDLEEGDLVSFLPRRNPRDGKLEACDVKLFTVATSTQLVEVCFKSNDRVFWGGVVQSYLEKRPLAQAAAIASKKLETLRDYDKTLLVSALSNDVLRFSETLREFLPNDKRLEVVLEGYAELSQPDEEKITAEIKMCLTKLVQNSSLWEEVPAEVLLLPYIWPLVPHHQRVAIFTNEIEEVKSLHSSFDDRWQELSRQAKIMLIFRWIKEDKVFPEPKEEKDEMVNAVLSLSRSADTIDKSLTFQSFHAAIQNYVVRQAWSSSVPLNFFPLLPDCLSKKESAVEYCEARAWPTQEDREAPTQRVSRAFCPRLDGNCVLFKLGARLSFSNQGARLYPELEQEWSDWSLLEVFEALEINPQLPELRNPNEYIQKLSGWVNRLNEIRERLRCSVCDQIMPPNYEYAKNLARYNLTVVSCKHGSGHDNNIYLNHCWGCEKIIDSRESKIQVEGFYICVHCGSGPRSSSTYRQGSICPNCRMGNMRAEQTDEYVSKTRICQNPVCLHKIRLPAERNRTG
jgi:cold shock CspA family protein